jgi:hypothetical protein
MSIKVKEDDYTTRVDAFRAGFEAGQEAAKTKPGLTVDDVKKMSPAEIAARKPEVDAAMRASRARAGK